VPRKTLRAIEGWRKAKQAYELLYPEGPLYDSFRSCPEAKDCSKCAGTGEVFGQHTSKVVSAWPTGSSKAPWVERREPNDDAVLALSRASRVMLRIGGVSVQHQHALLVYHGPPGDHCEGVHGNRWVSIMPLCWPPAKRLLQRKGVIEAYRSLTEQGRTIDKAQVANFRDGELAASRLLGEATALWDLARDTDAEALAKLWRERQEVQNAA
jgi:hypothetical protein